MTEDSLLEQGPDNLLLSVVYLVPTLQPVGLMGASSCLCHVGKIKYLQRKKKAKHKKFETTRFKNFFLPHLDENAASGMSFLPSGL